MRAGKILVIGVGGFIALVVIALLAVWLLVNPNDYKPRIAAAVKDATGRELVLQGDIKLSVFPWIALELGPASLGNPAGFSEQPFVSFKRASVRARLLPLLSKRLEVGRVELDGLDVRLLKNAEGRGNWQGFGRPETQPSAAGPANAEHALQGIAGIKITNARVSYQKITLENLNLETGSFVDRAELPVTFHADVNRGVAKERAGVDARFNFSADTGNERYRIAALNVNSVVNLGGDDPPVRFSISTPAIDVDLKAQTLGAPAIVLNVAGAEVTASVQATSLIDAPQLTGSVTLAPVVVREYMARLGMPAPKARDIKAWSLVAASSRFEYGGNALRFEPLQGTLDDTHLQGSIALNLDSQAVKFNLSVDHIDVDRYLAPEAQPGVPQSGTAKPAVPPAPPVPPGPPTPAKPGEASKPLDANGTLSVGSVHLAPLDLTEVKVTVTTHDAVMHIFPLTAQIDGGRYSGDITLDRRSGTPTVSMDEHLTGIEVKKLSAQSKNLHMSGRGNVNLKATGRGDGADALMKTLNGSVEASVADGTVEGIDFGYELRRAEALIRRQDIPGPPNSKRTKFDAFKMSAQITNGVAATHDLTISSQVLKVTGQGSANLATKTLDFALLADTLRMAGNTPIQIPVKVTGAMSDPTVRPDVEALAKGALKQKLKDVLQDKLKDLFGKP